MSPTLSIAIEPIQRDAASGANVPDWNSGNVPLPGLRSPYHRMPGGVLRRAGHTGWGGAARGAGERGRERVERDVVRVGAHPELGVVGEVGVLERVAGVAAGRVRAGRHRDALQERRRADRELGEDPAPGGLVVLHDWIA